jgi:thymidylate synthase (FAD)
MAKVLPDGSIQVLDHGFVRLDDSMADDLSVVNSARVSFGRHVTEMSDADVGLIKFLMRDRHGTPFEHNSFRFHVRCPLFVAREWFRHRVGCLTGDAVVTFVNINGHSARPLRKTMAELWQMWDAGERDGHALPEATRREILARVAAGRSLRAIARDVGAGRRSVRQCVRGSTGMRSARSRLRKMRLRVLNEETQEFEIGHIDAVVDKGMQPVYRVRLADGKELKATENHQLMTSEGWLTLREAVGLVGHGANARATRQCSLLTNGHAAYRDREWMKARRAEGLSVGEIAVRARCSYHTVRKWLRRHDLSFERGEATRGRLPWNYGKTYSSNRTLSESHREAIRAARSGERSNFWRGGLSTERANVGRWTREQAPSVHRRFDYTCHRCNRRGGRLHAHHIVPVWRAPDLARDRRNLVSLCEHCHRAVHRTVQTELEFAAAMRHLLDVEIADVELPTHGYRLTSRAVRIVSVTYVGIEQTYDLCVAGAWKNFVANGIVVHNSFNEFSMRYAKATDDFYVPEPDDVRSQVGKPGAYSFEPVEAELAQTTREELQAVYEQAYETYERLVEQGVARELARAVIPVGAYTEFYWTVNARALMNFVSLRAADTAQREIRRYAEAVEALFAEKMPITHAAFVANDRTAP